jgi:hypothetical protein
MKFSQDISRVKWLSGEKNQRFEDHLCPLRTRTQMVLETLVFSLLNHLTWLISRENFIILSRWESNKSQNKSFINFMSVYPFCLRISSNTWKSTILVLIFVLMTNLILTTEQCWYHSTTIDRKSCYTHRKSLQLLLAFIENWVSHSAVLDGSDNWKFCFIQIQAPCIHS